MSHWNKPIFALLITFILKFESPFKSIIHHNQLLLTKNFLILNRWHQKCSPLQIIEPLTSKWRQKCSPLQIIEPLTSKIIEPIDRENLGTRLCYLTKREKAKSRFTSLSDENILNCHMQVYCTAGHTSIDWQKCSVNYIWYLKPFSPKSDFTD